MDILIHTSVKLVTHSDICSPGGAENFNPHEREARDVVIPPIIGDANILIHTSVKLVTKHGSLDPL